MFGLASAPRYLHITVQASLRAAATILRTIAIRLHESDAARADDLHHVARFLFAYADDFFDVYFQLHKRS